MAHRTIRRNPQGAVVRIGGLRVIGAVATIAGVRRIDIVAVVASITIVGDWSVCARKRIKCVVIEG